MNDDSEHPLDGGAQASGVVRVGDTVRRPAHARSGFVRDALLHLERAGFQGAPRWLGFDASGRETVSYVPGDVPHSLPFDLTDAQLLSASRLVGAFHDAAASFARLDGQETLCHGDLGPHNMVFRGDDAVAIIDWDAGLAPGRRAVDFAHAVWCCADVTEAAVPVAEQARRAALMCSAYPRMTPAVVVDELAARFRRAREQHDRAGRPEAAAIFDGLSTWLAEHAAELRARASAPRRRR